MDTYTDEPIFNRSGTYLDEERAIRFANRGYFDSSRFQLDRAEDVEPAIRYLTHPVNTGIWKLNVELKSGGKLCEYIWGELQSKLQQEKSSKKRNRLPENHIQRIRQQIFNSWNLLIALFRQIHILDLPENDYKPEADETLNLLVNMLDLPKFKKTFSDVYEYFENNIYHERFLSRANNLLMFRHGFIFRPSDPRPASRPTNVLYYSINRKSLNDFVSFLTLMDKVGTWKLNPVFSPEDEVFRPYFQVMMFVYKSFIEERSLRSLYEKAFSEYNSQRFQACISTLGLISEDYLTQIYETLFRDPCPRGQTLGQLYDLIQSKVAKRFQKELPKAPNINELYQLINNQIQQENSGVQETNIELLKIVREVVNFIKDDRAYAREFNTHEQTNNKNSLISLFPPSVSINLTDLIRYRNTASHKSRTPLGEFEAVRTLYSLNSLVAWWKSEASQIDWDDEPTAILRKIVEHSGNAEKL